MEKTGVSRRSCVEPIDRAGRDWEESEGPRSKMREPLRRDAGGSRAELVVADGGPL